MRVLGHMVTRNELGRWLAASLEWLADLCDGNVAVYDDQSDDGTAAFAESLDLHVEVRPDVTPSFSENEGLFRWAAWKSMERALRPRDRDWILVVDADELLLTNEANGDLFHVIRRLYEAITDAEATGQTTVTFKVAEIYGFNGMNWPLARTDGYWGQITACRLGKWRADTTFDARKEGGGSLPSTWPHAQQTHPFLELLHLGYARPEDRVAKHQRYTVGTGHNPRHVASILQPPTLSHWVGMRPPIR